MEQKSNSWALIVTSIIFVLGLIGIYTVFLLNPCWFGLNFTLNQSGVFGDSFGILTSLFSGLAFAGMLTAIYLQRKDLLQQQQELILTRKQSEAQSFESTLFHMLKLHNEIVNSIDLIINNKPLKGRDCIVVFIDKMKGMYRRDTDTNNNTERLHKAYSMFWDEYKTELGHYFRFLYGIFYLIREHKEKQELINNEFDENKYSRIVRSQISDQELVLIYYNCITKHGVAKFKGLAERYRLFDNLPVSMLINESDVFLVDKKAWGDNQEAIALYNQQPSV